MPADLPRPPPPAPPKIPAGMAPPIPAAHPSYSAEPYTAPKGMAPPLAAPPRAAPSFYGAAAAAGMPAVEVPGETKKEKPALLREAAGKRWVDTTLLEWPENDFRIFVGNLGNEVRWRGGWREARRCRAWLLGWTRACKTVHENSKPGRRERYGDP